MIRLIFVDDLNADRLLFKDLLTGSDPPWLRDVELTMASVVPPFSRLFEEFDGLILDEQMPGASGSAIAREIHTLNWRFPVIILTGEPGLMPRDVLTYCDGVLCKRTHDATEAFSPCNPLFGIRRWVRDIARIMDAKNGAAP